MPFSDFELARTTKIVGEWVERRHPPVHVRPQLDLDFRIVGPSFEFFEVLPAFGALPARPSRTRWQRPPTNA